MSQYGEQDKTPLQVNRSFQLSLCEVVSICFPGGNVEQFVLSHVGNVTIVK